MKIIKKTRSICPKCFEELDAVVYEKDNEVYMEKECAKHGKFDVLIEKDAKLYNKLMNNKVNNQQVTSRGIMLPFSRKCNLHCKVCYLPYKKKELSLKHFKQLISNFDGNHVWISGGEPTLRHDLVDLIRFVSKKRKMPILITDGIKLSDENYVKKLKDAGLEMVHLSLNALDKDLLRKTDGKDVLDLKLKGLKNVQKNGIYTILSTTIIKGLNDNEIEKIFRYYLDNPDFISELRIRGGARIGRCSGIEALCLSDMVKNVCDVINVPYKNIFKTFSKNRNPNSMPCKFVISMFFQKHSGGIRLLFTEAFSKKDPKEFLKSGYPKILLGYNILRHGGIRNLRVYLRDKILHKADVVMLQIHIRSWFTKHNLDLDELSYCRTKCLAEDGKIYSFCYSHVINERVAKSRNL
ncbi:MAG: radical SAM protein [Nanoarchaeota archaeon]|nr:radical SAM protein [Nanoarchaeota archaeon]